MEKTFEVLLATMNQSDDSVIERMNLQSDVIVCNQNRPQFTHSKYTKNGFNVSWYDFNEKGVGLNRNNALMRSTADICLLSDDDVVYEDGYVEIIKTAFEENPSADVVIFNLYSDGIPRYIIKKKKKINLLTCGRFGAVRIAFRRNSIIKNGITFNLLFGGGAPFSAGEDTAFLIDCINKGLTVISVPDYILSLDETSESSWFQGYSKKFFFDTGFTYRHHYKKMAPWLALILLIKHRNTFFSSCTMTEAWEEIRNGIKKYDEY